MDLIGWLVISTIPGSDTLPASVTIADLTESLCAN